MRITSKFIIALLGSTLMAGTALADSNSAPPAAAAAAPAATTPSSSSQSAQDALKLSKEAAKAFQDIQRARLAIYEVDPDQAKKSIKEASEALAKSKKDDAAFTKAESDMKAPAGTQNPPNGSTQPTTWVPFDGQMTLGEDFAVTPEKAAAVKEANKHFAKGDKKAALDRLKLAQVYLYFNYALAPLDKSIAGVEQAKSFIDAGKYYEANAELKKVQDGVRFDTVVATDTPSKEASGAVKPAPATGNAAKPAAPAAPSK